MTTKTLNVVMVATEARGKKDITIWNKKCFNSTIDMEIL